jgi:hypothetical protein
MADSIGGSVKVGVTLVPSDVTLGGPFKEV